MTDYSLTMGRKGFKRKRGPAAAADRASTTWSKEKWAETPISAAFVRYYQAQQIVPADEWAAFQGSCQMPLPISFRFNANVPVTAAIATLARGDYDQICEAAPVENLHPEWRISAPVPFSWYPGAWQIGATKRQLKKHPQLSDLNQWLSALNENGFITRQEAVSMIPALLLDVNESHAVLDTCAAPGSKTAQILELVSAGGSLSDGFVIANDASPQRAHHLTHQLNRLSLPSFIVTNHDAQHFPALTFAEGARLTFDRILCDVPCSGDGTVRKNSEIWAKWSSMQGVGLHRLQMQIVKRALQLLKPGGRIVYSTCSLNPVENEAVVAELLRSTPALQLLDTAGLLPGLVRRRGLPAWKVFNGDVEYASIGDVPDECRNAFRPSLFPPSSEEEFHLERCMRLLPHDQNTGGFFVAVLVKNEEEVSPDQKVDSSKDVCEKVENADEASENAGLVTKSQLLHVDSLRKRLTSKNKGEVFFRICDFPEHESVLHRLRETFDLSADFPIRQLWCRSSSFSSIGRIYLVNRAVDSILESTFNRSGPRPLKIIHSGILIFENSRRKNPRAPPYRVSHSGAGLLLPFLGKRKLYWPLEKFRELLTEKKVEGEETEEYGSVVVVWEKLVATCWATSTCVELMVQQTAIDCLLSALPPSPPSSQ